MINEIIKKLNNKTPMVGVDGNYSISFMDHFVFYRPRLHAN